MAVPQNTDAASTVKLFDKVALKDAYRDNSFPMMISSGAVYDARELNGKNAGDQETISYYKTLNGTGTTEGGILANNLEQLDDDTHILKIGMVRHGVKTPGSDSIEQKRVFANLMNIGRDMLSPWGATRVDQGFFQQAAGAYPTTITLEGATYTGTKRAIVTGFNTVTAPTTNRIIRAANRANDQSLTSSDVFTVDLLDDALIEMKKGTKIFKPLPSGRIMAILDPQQVLDAQRDSSGSIQWLRDIERPLTEGTGKSSLAGSQPVNTVMKKVATYKCFDIYESNRVATGVSSADSSAVANTRRAILLGKGGLCYSSAFGTVKGGNGPVKFFYDKIDNYYDTVESRLIFGVNKPVYDGEDYGVFVISTYAAD